MAKKKSIINLSRINNAIILKNSTSNSITNTSSKFHVHIVISLKDIHPKIKHKKWKRKSKHVKKSNCDLTFGGGEFCLYLNTMHPYYNHLFRFLENHLYLSLLQKLLQ